MPNKFSAHDTVVMVGCWHEYVRDALREGMGVLECNSPSVLGMLAVYSEAEGTTVQDLIPYLVRHQYSSSRLQATVRPDTSTAAENGQQISGTLAASDSAEPLTAGVSFCAFPWVQTRVIP